MLQIDIPENIVLLKLVSKTLFGSDEPIDISGIDLKKLFQESKDQSVIAIAFSSLPQEAKELDPVVYSAWENYVFQLTGYNLRLLYANVSLTKLLLENNIPHCTLKGCVSASYYKKPNLRQMGDIDFLVAKSDYERALSLLVSKGFRNSDIDHVFHRELFYNNFIYELHFQIGEAPKVQELIFDLIEDIIPTSSMMETDCGTVSSPNTFNHGLVILFHMQRHIELGEGIGLRHLCDWAVFVNSLSDEQFRSMYEEKLKSIGLWRFAKIMSQISSAYLGIEYKPWFGKPNNNLNRSMIEDIFESGNFGHKDQTRTQSSFLLERDAKKHTVFVRMILNLNYIVSRRYPFFAKSKLLLPIGYLIVIFRMLFLVLTGKKKTSIKKMTIRSIERNNVYRQLRLFEKQQ